MLAEDEINLRRVATRARTNSGSTSRLSTKIFLLWSSAAFHGNDDVQLDIYEEICGFLKLPMSSIRLVGSAHVGFSLVSGVNFNSDKSDLDIAIVDPNLYLELFQLAFEQTSGWTDVAAFGTGGKARKKMEGFRYSLERGVIRPDLLPASPRKASWTNFFGSLSAKHLAFCNGITAFVYAREAFLTAKQQSAVEMFISNEGSL